MQNTLWQSGNDSKWFLKKIFFQNTLMARKNPPLHGKYQFQISILVFLNPALSLSLCSKCRLSVRPWLWSTPMKTSPAWQRNTGGSKGEDRRITFLYFVNYLYLIIIIIITGSWQRLFGEPQTRCKMLKPVEAICKYEKQQIYPTQTELILFFYLNWFVS